MLLENEVLTKVKNLNPKTGSFVGKVSQLLLSGEFHEPMNSQAFTQIYNEGPGKNIRPNQLTALMEPLLKKEIIKVKTIKEGKKKTKFWFPAWIYKKEAEKEINPSKNKIAENLHPEISKVSQELFKDGHYAQAIEEAFKKVISLVKKKSGRKDLDGFNLMSTVFSKQKPLLKFNSLSDRTEEDEQQGWMHLYQGAVLGIRNVKAHSNAVQKDSKKASEYLCFASLLCRRLDETKKSP